MIKSFALDLKPYTALIRAEKPIGSFLLLWPTLIGLWFASGGIPEPRLLLCFVAGVLVMRSAGCAINDIFDRNIDGKVFRTQHRPLATGQLSVWQASLLFITFIAVAFIIALQLNPLSQRLAVIAALLAVLYPLMKRYTRFPQMVLGIAFSWGPLMAFSEIGKRLVDAQLIFWATFFWTVAFDTQYAMVDKADDQKIGVRSTAITFSPYERQWVLFFQTLVIFLLLQLGVQYHLSRYYYLGISVCSLFFVYQYRLTQDPTHCFRAFLNNNYFGMSVFLVVFLALR